MESEEEPKLQATKAPPLREDSYHIPGAARGMMSTLLGVGKTRKKVRPYLQKERRIAWVVASTMSRTTTRISKIVLNVSVTVELRIK